MFFLRQPDVQRLKASGKVKGLIRALDYKKSSDIRKAAAEAIGEVGGGQAVSRLIDALGDTAADVRKAARAALVKIGESAVEPLIAALKVRDDSISDDVAWALGQIGDVRAVGPLTELLQDPGYAGQFGVSAVGALGGVESLIAALTTGNTHVKRCAVQLLAATIGDGRSVLPLIGALMDASGDVREGASKALIKIGEPAVVLLVEALSDSESMVRRSIATVLVKIGQSAVDPLVRALQDGSKEVRVVAAHSLGEIGGSLVNKPLAAALEDPEQDVRLAAVAGLGKLGESGTQTLTAALKHKDEKVRELASSRLTEIDKARAESATGQLFGLFEDAARLVAAGKQVDIEALKRQCESCIESGADVQARRGIATDTPLMRVTTLGALEVVRLMLDLGVPAGRFGSYKRGPIYAAAYAGKHEILQLLIDHGADVNTVDTELATPLIAAAMHGHTLAAKVLVDSGADADYRHPMFGTAEDLAYERGYTETALAILEAKRKRQPVRRADPFYPGDVKNY